MMLEHLGWQEAGKLIIDGSLDRSSRESNLRFGAPDGRRNQTEDSEFASAIIENMQ